MTPSSRCALYAISLLAPLIWAMPVEAQDAIAATDLYHRGFAHMEEGRYDVGCKELQDSLRLDRRAGTLFTLAVCESRWGRIATAVARFDEYLSLYSKLPPDQQAVQKSRPKIAKEERDRIAPAVPELTLLLPPQGPGDIRVTRNGEPVDRRALDQPLRVDPGEHVISTQVPGGEVWEKRVAIGKNEKLRVPLEVKPAPSPQAAVPPDKPAPPGAQSQPPAKPNPDAVKAQAPPPQAVPADANAPVSQAAADQAPGGRRIAALVVGGVGLAGLVAGGVAGGMVFAKKGVVKEHCGSAIGVADENACDVTGFEAWQSAQTLGLGSTIGFAVGLAGVGTAAILLLTAPKQPASHPSGPANSPTASVQAAILSAGPQGVALGLRGAW